MRYYCKVYTSGDKSKSDLLYCISTFFDATRVSASYVETDKFDISVDENDEFDQHKQIDFPDGFLFSRFYIEMEFTEDQDINYAVEIVSRLLNWLWMDLKMPAVASCNYEELLPMNGGYKSKDIPWFI